MSEFWFCGLPKLNRFPKKKPKTSIRNTTGGVVIEPEIENRSWENAVENHHSEKYYIMKLF